MHDKLPKRGITVIFIQNKVTHSFNKGSCVQKMNIHEWTQKKVTSVLFLVKCLGLKKAFCVVPHKMPHFLSEQQARSGIWFGKYSNICWIFSFSIHKNLVFGLENIRKIFVYFFNI